MNSKLRKFGWVSLAAFIALGPGLVQLLGIDLLGSRGWRMYSTVGVGAPYGHFIIERGSDTTEVIPIAEALGVSHINQIQRYRGSGSVSTSFESPQPFREVAQPYCASLTADDSMRFEGRVATRRQWQPLQLDGNLLCGPEEE